MTSALFCMASSKIDALQHVTLWFVQTTKSLISLQNESEFAEFFRNDTIQVASVTDLSWSQAPEKRREDSVTSKMRHEPKIERASQELAYCTVTVSSRQYYVAGRRHRCFEKITRRIIVWVGDGALRPTAADRPWASCTFRTGNAGTLSFLSGLFLHKTCSKRPGEENK